MEQHLEIEFKTMLTKKEFHRLYKTMTFKDGFLQINSYFDTMDNFFLKNHSMLRIRTIDNSFIFTMKTPKRIGVLEHEFTMESFNINHPKIQKLIEDFNIKTSDLDLITQSKTIRHEINDEYGTWCLDLNEFTFNKDYELEYELFEGVDYDKAQQHYYNSINNLNISYKKAKPKYIRALDQI